MRQSLLFVFLISVCSVQAQFKKLTFDPNVKINAGEKNIQLVKPQTNAQPKTHNSVEYASMDLSAVAALKSGLTPGILNENKVPVYIEGSLKVNGKKGRTAENLAWEYLENAAPLMKIKEPTNEFTLISAQDDELGMTHVKLQQQVKGVPVYGAYVMVHGQNQNYDFLNGTYFPTIDLDKTTPSFDTQMSKNIVRNELGEKPDYSDNIKLLFENYNDDSKLVVYPYENNFYLAYHVSSYKNIVERWEYFIDAITGKVINKYQSICKFHNHTSVKGEKCNHTEIEIVDGKATANALDLFNVNRIINTYEVGNKFYMIDGSRDIFSSTPSNLPDDPEGVIWTIDAFNTSPQKDNFNYGHVTSANNIWNNKTAVSSHYNGGKAFEYFRNSHNRKSINGSGGNIISLINVADEDGGSMGNAFWNGQAMFYGNGDNAFQPLAKGLDVAGHEMTHGVVEGTANLEYQGESGALNESFADIFGAKMS
jgi:Zn-dependent metalloprotease